MTCQSTFRICRRVCLSTFLQIVILIIHSKRYKIGKLDTAKIHLTTWNWELTNLRDNLPNLRFKAHIKHAISLIQHQICHSPQICVTTFQHVNQPTWCSYDNLNTCRIHRTLRQVLHRPQIWNTNTYRRETFLFSNDTTQTFLEISNLWSLGCTPINACVLYLWRRAKLGRFLLDLHCKLPSRGQHKHNRPISWCWKPKQHTCEKEE